MDTIKIPSWSFSDRLRKARHEADLTQHELADAIGINRSTYSSYEAGISSPRSGALIDFAVKIQAITSISAGWLIGLPEQPERPPTNDLLQGGDPLITGRYGSWSLGLVTGLPQQKRPRPHGLRATKIVSRHEQDRSLRNRTNGRRVADAGGARPPGMAA